MFVGITITNVKIIMLADIIFLFFFANTVHSKEGTCFLKFSELQYSINAVICPAGCWRETHELCGTNVYGDGPVCLAAIHAGTVSEFGGLALVFKTKGFKSSPGSTQFGVTTSTCGRKARGYAFSVSCSTKGNTEYNIMEIQCPPNCQKDYVHVADKNGVYSINSSVCAAAYQEKITDIKGGMATVYKHSDCNTPAAWHSETVNLPKCTSTTSTFSFRKPNACVPNPCQNGATCHSILVNEYRCECTSSDYGANCDITDALWGTGGYRASNGYIYKITSTSQTFQESRTACRRLAGQMAYVGMRNSAVYRELMQHFLSGWDHAWIDLSDLKTEGKFRWGDGVLVSGGWINWGKNEPNNLFGAEDCVEIYRPNATTWNDNSCSKQFPALCEKRI